MRATFVLPLKGGLGDRDDNDDDDDAHPSRAVSTQLESAPMQRKASGMHRRRRQKECRVKDGQISERLHISRRQMQSSKDWYTLLVGM